MLRILTTPLIALTILMSSCSNGQTQSGKVSLNPDAFASKIKEMSNAIIVDVRTPEEYASGHIAHAININWNSNEFKTEISKIDKNKPVFIYCLSGGRSSAAASHMLADGFKEIYELQGGMLKWRSANMPETKNDNAPTTQGMNLNQFKVLLNSDKLVLVDFYAEWCAPCKKMKPYLDEIDASMKDKVKVVRINTDQNKSLTQELHIDALPTLQLYKNATIIWSHVGYISKEDLLKHLHP
jgi:thioredoxin